MSKVSRIKKNGSRDMRFKNKSVGVSLIFLFKIGLFLLPFCLIEISITNDGLTNWDGSLPFFTLFFGVLLFIIYNYYQRKKFKENLTDYSNSDAMQRLKDL